MKTSLTLENGTENSLSIPFDLIFDIFLRLPVKSIAGCRCVSKLWASILSRQDFTELFLTRSRVRPQLLFVFVKGCELSFFSSPQLQNPDDENSCPVVANYQMKFFVGNFYQVPRPVNGLICVRSLRLFNEMKETVLMICNLSTGQSLPLPKVNGSRTSNDYFGYDPIDKQYKVLLTSSYEKNGGFDEHQILTLGNVNMSWRMIQCCIPHYSLHLGTRICINGVLYYYAGNYTGASMIVCFDVRSEEFRFIIRAVSRGPLVNFKGKVGLYSSENFRCNRERESIEVWVLEDAKKQEWSKHTYILPSMWQNIVRTSDLRFVGMTQQTNEFVFQSEERMPLYVFYYNVETQTIKKVEMQGMEAFKDNNVYIFQDHVENVRLLYKCLN